MNFYNYEIDLWTFWGFLAQFVFLSSFLVQWYKSEKKKKSFLPLEFWILRITGSLMLIIYVIHRKDIVFLVALILQIAIYIRNITLMKNEKES